MADEPIADVVARVLDLDGATTSGPWQADSAEIYTMTMGWVAESLRVDDPGGSEADAEWIATTRTDAATLAREVARLTEELRWTRQALEAGAGHSSPMLAAGLRAIAAGPS